MDVALAQSGPVSDSQSPFGTYALTPLREQLRRFGDLPPAGSRPGRIFSSACRRLSLLGSKHGLDGPYDIEIEGGTRARLYPGSNRCEKRAFAGLQHWDSNERASIVAQLDTSVNRPFVFMDVGANVGLYSILVHGAAKRLDREIRIIAVEPDPETRSRLEFNVAASSAAVEVMPVAISDNEGVGHLTLADGNRGEVRLSDTGTTQVPLETMHGLARRLDLSHIDALKLDIEGHDLVALDAFFQRADAQLHPELLILETGRDKTSPLIELAQRNNYMLDGCHELNAILRRKPRRNP